MQKPESFSEQNESFQGIIFLLFHIHHSSLNAKNRASTALGHRHHSNESDGLGYARPGAQTERSRGHFHTREKSVPERSRGRSPSVVEGIFIREKIGPRAKPRGQSSGEVKNGPPSVVEGGPRAKSRGACLSQDQPTKAIEKLLQFARQRMKSSFRFIVTLHQNKLQFSNVSNSRHYSNTTSRFSSFNSLEPTTGLQQLQPRNGVGPSGSPRRCSGQ